MSNPLGGGAAPGGWTVWSRGAGARGKRNDYRNTRKTPTSGSLTFSSLFNFKPDSSPFPQARYPRLSQYLQDQETILTNIGDKLDLLNLACRVRTCSNRLKRFIAREMGRRVGAGYGRV